VERLLVHVVPSDGPRRARVRKVTALKEYNASLYELPDYRLTCFFVDRDYRRKGVAAVALRGAPDLIAKAGGGVVEAYPQRHTGQEDSGSFLYNGTRSLSEKAGFSSERSKGKNHCMMRRTVLPS
jgi:GNAT superfamily N-acetyltransferase